MGGKSSGGTKTYYGTVAGVVCAGPVDELCALIIDGSTVWPTQNHWNDGAVELEVTEVRRSGGTATLWFDVDHGCSKGDHMVVTGLPDASFDCAVATAITGTSSRMIQYANAGPNVAQTAVASGLMSKARHYAVADLANYLGITYKATAAHYATPDTEPPNGAYWARYTVTRAGSANPYPFTVKDYGQAYFYWGTDDQVLDTAGEAILAGLGHPPYRRQAVVVLKDFKFGVERQEAPNLEALVIRGLSQTLIAGASAALDGDKQANPAAVVAELLTDPIFGLGKANAAFDAASWQAVADSLVGAAPNAYVSPVLDKAQTGREWVGQALAYYDGWLRFGPSGTIQAGRFLHGELPLISGTIAYTDLVDEIQWDADGWAASFNETVAKFQDLARAYKDAARIWISGLNRQVVGEPRRATLDRPWITREAQAASHAAEWGKIYAQPKLSGELTVRMEKAAGIGVGDLFTLTHDALQLSVICRCNGKTLEAPPAGRVTMKFENERGLAAIPYSATLPGPGELVEAAPEDVSLYQIMQPPPALTGETGFELMVLAARKSPSMVGLKVWLRAADGAVFYLLGQQTAWAISGTVAATVGAPSGGADWATSFGITLSEFSVQGDVANFAGEQSADAVNDNAVLVWVFHAGVFEAMTLSNMALAGGVYTLQVTRGRFGTQPMALTAGDAVWVAARSGLVSYSHAKFADYALAGTGGVLRLQAFTQTREADLTDGDVCPDLAFVLAPTFAPGVSWLSIQKKGPGDADFIDIGDFTATFDSATQFKLSCGAGSSGGLITQVALVAKLGSQQTSLFAQDFSASGYQTCVAPAFVLPSPGSWQLFAVVSDSVLGVTWHELQPVGGGAAVHLQVGPTTTVLTPMLTPSEGGVKGGIATVAVTCATAGATIYWAMMPPGVSPTGWINHSVTPLTGFRLYPPGTPFFGSAITLWLYAAKAGMTQSGPVRYDFWYLP